MDRTHRWTDGDKDQVAVTGGAKKGGRENTGALVCKGQRGKRGEHDWQTQDSPAGANGTLHRASVKGCLLYSLVMMDKRTWLHEAWTPCLGFPKEPHTCLEPGLRRTWGLCHRCPSHTTHTINHHHSPSYPFLVSICSSRKLGTGWCPQMKDTQPKSRETTQALSLL